MANAISNVRTAPFPAPSKDLSAAGRIQSFYMENAIQVRSTLIPIRNLLLQASLEDRFLIGIYARSASFGIFLWINIYALQVLDFEWRIR